MNFRVKRVAKATYQIEEPTANFDGLVTYTLLNSRIDNTSAIAVSADSILETIYYTVANEMVPGTEYKTRQQLKVNGQAH